MPTVHVQTAQNVTIAYRTAGLGPRIIAYLVDVFITYACLFTVAMVFISASGSMSEGVGIALVVIVLLPFVFYHLLCEVFLDGQSIGKRVVKIKVVALDGGQPTLGAYLLRWVLRIVDVSLFSGGVAVIAIAATKHDQRLGDLAAGTTVIKLDHEVGLEDTLYVPVGDDHETVYPQVDRLTDADVETVRAVLARFREDGRTARTAKLADRTKAVIEQKMEIEPVAAPAVRFLRQVVRDYSALEDSL